MWIIGWQGNLSIALREFNVNIVRRKRQLLYNPLMSAKQIPSITVRPYQDSDYSGVRQIFEIHKVFYEPFDSQEKFKAKIDRDPESILIAALNKEVVGTVSLMEDGRMAFIFRLAVKPESKNAGVGILLMHQAEKELFSRGYKEIHILVDSNNEQLADYYKKRGYETGHKYRWMTKER